MTHLRFFYKGLLLLSFLTLVSCDHETDFFDGPNLIDRFGEFNLVEGLSASASSVDFAAGETVFFQAQFNKRVNFVLSITGTESGAVKRIEGFDNILNADNATWEGGTTDLPLFGEELCMVELLIPEADSLRLTTEVTSTSRKNYEGNVYTAFENDPADNIFFGNFEFEFTANTGRRNDGLAAEGDWYYFFEGTDDVVPNFFVGLIDIQASITGNTYAPVPTTIPEELYFNAFMYSDGGPHGIAVLQVVTDTNDSGAFEDGPDQTFQVEGDFPLNWIGWRQVSFALGELGMTEEQVSKIVNVRALLISDMNSQPNPPLQVDYRLDYITFTAGQPLQL